DAADHRPSAADVAIWQGIPERGGIEISVFDLTRAAHFGRLLFYWRIGGNVVEHILSIQKSGWI
ncbi:MAG: hypothetical protein J0665_06270, partial [Deltaproteobacteria bacterium]|nr:hypothetical protein [Deltaproteobacteria bacterium]